MPGAIAGREVKPAIYRVITIKVRARARAVFLLIGINCERLSFHPHVLPSLEMKRYSRVALHLYIWIGRFPYPKRWRPAFARPCGDCDALVAESVAVLDPLDRSDLTCIHPLTMDEIAPLCVV